MMFHGYGECWDCGKEFHKHQQIRIGGCHSFHKRCAKAKKWIGLYEFIDACVIWARWIFAGTPILYKKGDVVEIGYYQDLSVRRS